jgi:hypothetical protein
MNEDILFFVKFGERSHMESLSRGEMYFSLADEFIKQEEMQQKKGQGDSYEGRMNMLFNQVVLRNPETKEVLCVLSNSNMNFGFETVANMPLFCLTAGYAKDCKFINDNKYHILFSEMKTQVICEHFEKADTALIIKQPNVFIEDVKKVFNKKCKADTIKYYNMSILTTDRLKYLMDITKIQSGKEISINIKDAYKHLFCKDFYFEEQQEFRFIANELHIKQPTIYKIDMNSKTELIDLKDFFNGVNVEF